MNSTNKDIDLYIENNLYKYLPSIFDASNHQIKTSETIAVHEIKEIKSQIHANIKRAFLSNRDKKLRYGDIIGIPRKPLLNLVPYDHYGVYVNHDSVIHFSSKESDVSSLNNTIIETSLRIFTREDSGIFRLNFPDVYGKPTQIYVDETKLAFERSKYFIHDCVNNYFEKLKKYHLYGPSETVKRARSKLGAKGYNIITNNCEHFAIWCKTGLYESHQVEYYANLLSPFKTKLDSQNNTKRAYIPDPDLEFLKRVPNEDIDTLVNYLIKDKDGALRMTELLTLSDAYKLHAPDHHQYWKEIAAELQCFGANSIATLLRGGKGVLYKKILSDVCDKMKVVYDKSLPTDVIEMHLMIKILTESMSTMSPEQVKTLVDELHLNTTDLTPQAVAFALQAGVRLSGFLAYELALIVANTVAKAVLGRGLSLAANATITRAVSLFAGPAGWILTGLWTAFDIAGPAYRVTIPAVIQIAFLRLKMKYALPGQAAPLPAR